MQAFDQHQQFVIVGIHRSVREVIGWAGKDGFVPLSRAESASKLQAIGGDVAEELMKHITKRSTTSKYEFVLVPVMQPTTAGHPSRKSEAGLILPHLH